MATTAFPLLHKALKRAFKAHKKQDRDGDSPLPYITHPIEVVNILRYEAGVVEEEVLVAAALHDVVEENRDEKPEDIFEDIEDDFGRRVARLVRELTREEPDRSGLTEEEVWQVRTQVMLEEIDAMSPEAKKIKLADRLSNLRNAMVTRSGDPLHRYVRQSQIILQHIEEGVQPDLWRSIRTIVDGVDLPPRVASLTPAAPETVQSK